MNENFNLEIISPEKIILKIETNEVIIPAFEGLITLLKDQIRQAENQLQYVCSLDGHNIVTERDPGMYGELFRTCTKCKVSF